MKMYENKNFKRDAFIKVTRETRATAGKLVEGIVGAIGNVFSGGSSKSDAGTDKIMLNPRF
jgi:hypothetical protein